MDFAALALICAVALFGPLLSAFRLVRLPVAIGELAVGVLVGQSGFGWLEATDPTFSFLASAGFLMVMVVAGHHVPIRDPNMRAGFRTGVLRALAIGALAVPVGLGVAAVAGTDHGLLYAVVIASSSASITMPLIDSLSGHRTQLATMLPQVAVADATCMVLVPLVLERDRALAAALGTLAVLAAGAVLAVVLHVLARTGHTRRLHEFSESRGLALELRLCLMVAFGIAAVATAAHVSVMLAGFVVGLALHFAGPTKRLSHQLFAVTEGLFAPIFFVWLGTTLDLRDLAEHPSSLALGLGLGVTSVAVHCLPRLWGQPWSFAMMASAQMGVPVVSATLGAQLGILPPNEATALLVSALFTVTVATLARRHLSAPGRALRPAD